METVRHTVPDHYQLPVPGSGHGGGAVLDRLVAKKRWRRSSSGGLGEPIELARDVQVVDYGVGSGGDIGCGDGEFCTVSVFLPSSLIRRMEAWNAYRLTCVAFRGVL
jgi:hypothetical protein